MKCLPPEQLRFILKKIPCYAQFQAAAVISFLQNAFQGMAVASF